MKKYIKLLSTQCNRSPSRVWQQRHQPSMMTNWSYSDWIRDFLFLFLDIFMLEVFERWVTISWILFLIPQPEGIIYIKIMVSLMIKTTKGGFSAMMCPFLFLSLPYSDITFTFCIKFLGEKLDSRIVLPEKFVNQNSSFLDTLCPWLTVDPQTKHLDKNWIQTLLIKQTSSKNCSEKGKCVETDLHAYFLSLLVDPTMHVLCCCKIYVRDSFVENIVSGSNDSGLKSGFRRQAVVWQNIRNFTFTFDNGQVFCYSLMIHESKRNDCLSGLLSSVILQNKGSFPWMKDNALVLSDTKM